MSKALLKDTLRAVKNHISRYISIVLIIALGTAFFVGVKAAAPDMFATAEKYFSDCNLMDIRLQSPAGLTDADIEAVKRLNGVQYAAGEKFTDALVRVNGEIETDIDGTQISARAYGISPKNITDFLNGMVNGSYINRPQLIEGRYPSSVNECLVDASRLSTPENYKIGNVITLENSSGDKPAELKTAEFTITGIIRSPYYISFERGNTNIGSGKIGTFIIIPDEAFGTDYYSEAYIKVQGTSFFDPYSDGYFEYISPVKNNISALAENRMPVRKAELKPQLEKKIAEGEQTIANSSAELSVKLKELDSTIALLEELVASGDDKLALAQKEFNEKFSGAEDILSGNTEKYNNAVKEYTEKQQLFIEKQGEYNEKKLLLDKASDVFNEYRSAYQAAAGKVESAAEMIKSTKSIIEVGENTLNKINDLQTGAYSDERLQEIINAMQVASPALYEAIKALTTHGLAIEIANYLAPYLQTKKAELARQEADIQQKQQQLDEIKIQLDEKQTELEGATEQLAGAYEMLQETEKQLSAASAVLSSLGYDIQSGGLKLQMEKFQAQARLNELKSSVAAAPQNLAAAKQKRAEALSALDSGLREAETQLVAAKNLYNRLDSLSWSVYDRNDTPGYTSYFQSVKNIQTLSNVFPVFFFLLAAIVCLTTLTRMIDEDRVLIGTYLAVGYSSAAVIGKYIIYSLSACIAGSIIGTASAVFFFPFAINAAYSLMYSLPELVYIFPWRQCLVSFLISFACTALVTVAAIAKELKKAPAVLMRPKTPRAGKRIFLERIKGLWGRLNFTSKVTARNIFRNKQRFFMAFLGIAGCSAMLLASLGMYDSIDAVITKQYIGKNAVSKYDFQLVFSSVQSEGTHSYEFTSAEKNPDIDSLMLTAMKSMTCRSERSGRQLDAYVFVPEKPQELNGYISLHSRGSDTEYTLDDSGAVISEKLAVETKTAVGDNISFTDSDGTSYSVRVSAIVENYTFHYIYLSPNVYKAATGSKPKYNYAIGTLSQELKSSDKTTLATSKGMLADALMKTDGIAAVAYISDTAEIISQITDALAIVIMIFFVSALVLAFVVLYNLTNINIIERTREIATLKVLGFTDKEVNSYIYRENIFVSVFGILFGAFLGVGLHYLLITFTSIDTVMYGQSISLRSYITAFVLTALILVLVNLLLRKKLRNVNMVLSLKSVE